MADLRTVLTDLFRRAGLEPDADADLRLLDGRLPGLVLSRRGSVRDVVESVQQAHPVDVVESGGRLRLQPRGGDAALALGEDDLVPFDDGSLVQIVRRQENELPAQVDVLYASAAADFQTATQTARRQAGQARSAVSVELPLVLDDDKARGIAERLLFEHWIERDAYSFRLSARHAALEPTDVVTLTAGGRTVRLRITRIESTVTTLHLAAVPDDPTLLVTRTPGGTPAAKLAEVRVVPETVLFALDIPLLRDADDGPGWYAAASCGGTATWPGAVLLESADGGLSWGRLAELRGPATWGVCETVPADGPTTHWDEANSLTVRLRRGRLEGRSRQAVLNGANAAVVGKEIIQFRDAELVGAGTYRLTGLLRGRRGTERATADHAAGEILLLLGAQDLLRIAGRQERVGAESLFRAVTSGLYAEDQSAVSFTNSAAGLRPFSVAHPRVRTEANGDRTITWIRRTRLNAGWIDGADVPLGEESEAYEIDILADGRLRRRLSASVPALTYPAALRAEDAAGAAALSARIHQISATVGRGPAREVPL